MKKNQIITIIVVIVLFFAGFIGWFLVEKNKIAPGENGQAEETKEILSLSAIVESVDQENGFLMVSSVDGTGELKIIVSETTDLIKLEFPFDPANPPANPSEETSFTPKQTPIELSDFKVGDNVFIKSKEDIVGKNELSNVDFIHILP